MRSFERVTGPKTDRWLVKTVGTLALANGIVLGIAASRRRVSDDAVNLGVATALAFATIDTVYVLRRRISRIYLADAVLEALFIALIVGTGDDDAPR